MSWFGRIAQKHIDFLICDITLKPKFAIELDDNSHNGSNDSDEFKNNLFKICDLKIIRIKAQIKYSEEYILKYLELSHNPPKEKSQYEILLERFIDLTEAEQNEVKRFLDFCEAKKQSTQD